MSDLEAYNKQHPNRSKKDNYTIALRKESRALSEKTIKRHLAAIALMPVYGVGLPVAMGNMYVATKKNRVLSDIMDEYNIENAKRIINM